MLTTFCRHFVFFSWNSGGSFFLWWHNWRWCQKKDGGKP